MNIFKSFCFTLAKKKKPEPDPTQILNRLRLQPNNIGSDRLRLQPNNIGSDRLRLRNTAYLFYFIFA